jgi:hypothetical protein
LKTCGNPSCSYELRARATRGNIYGNRGGGPARKLIVQYTGAHKRARMVLKDDPCALSDESCRGRLEVALRADAPKERVFLDERRGIFYYSGPDQREGYRRLCRSHHAREGSATQVIARITDPELAEAVRKNLELV